MFNKFKYLIVSLFVGLTVFSLFFILKVKVNYNTLDYLPEDSKTKIALEKLEAEFGAQGMVFVLVEDLGSSEEVEGVKEILFFEGVQGITYDQKENDVLYQVQLKEDNYSELAQEVIKEIIERLEKEDLSFYLDGESYQTYVFNEMMIDQIINVVLILIPVVLIILLLMTRSFLEPLLFVIVMAISVLINMGTNAFLPSVSYMTYLVAPVVQFAVCMDYSIMLLHRFQDCSTEGLEPNAALKKAWKSSLIPIIASAVTTIAGFTAIMFMKYKIGLDIGLVLVKGVSLSLLTVLFLMPALILFFNKILLKTQHQSLFTIISQKLRQKKGRKEGFLSIFIYRTRFILPILIIALIIGGFFVQRNNNFLYSDASTTKDMEEIAIGKEKIENSFGRTSQSVLLLDATLNTEDLIMKLEKLDLDGKTYISQFLAYDKQYDLESLMNLFGGDLKEEELALVFQVINKNQDKDTISLRELNAFLEMTGNKLSLNEMILYLNNFVEIEESDVEFIYQLSSEESLSLIDIITFLQTNYSVEELKLIFAGKISPTQIEQVSTALGKDELNIPELIGGFSTIVNTPLNYTSLASHLTDDYPPEMLQQIYLSIGVEELSLKDFMNFIGGEFSQTEIALLMPTMDPSMVNTVFSLMDAQNLLNEGKTSLKNFLLFIRTNFSGFFSEEEAELIDIRINELQEMEATLLQIGQMEKFLAVASSFDSLDASLFEVDPSLVSDMFFSNDYQRLIFKIDLPNESETSFAFQEKLEKLLSENIEGDYYLVSGLSAIKEVKTMVDRDYLLTSILSIAMVFIVIAISFKSLTIPVILVLLIQGAVYINMGIPALTGEPLVFIGYIIISCLQLGATIDYAILVTHRYLNNRTTKPKKESIIQTLHESVNSIVNSGLILATAGFVLYFVAKMPVVASMGKLIGFGGSISMIIVIFVLPQLLLFFDRFLIIKKTEE